MGENKKAAIAAVLAMKLKILIMNETTENATPLTSTSYKERVKILEALREVCMPIELNELAEKTNLSMGRTLGYLAILIKAGCVEKTRRQYSITSDGKKALTALQPVPQGKEFHFHTKIGEHTGLSAKGLIDFCELLKAVDIRALKFHVFRGDFEKWITEVLHDTKLADEIGE